MINKKIITFCIPIILITMICGCGGASNTVGSSPDIEIQQNEASTGNTQDSAIIMEEANTEINNNEETETEAYNNKIELYYEEDKEIELGPHQTYGIFVRILDEALESQFCTHIETEDAGYAYLGDTHFGFYVRSGTEIETGARFRYVTYRALDTGTFSVYFYLGNEEYRTDTVTFNIVEKPVIFSWTNFVYDGYPECIEGTSTEVTVAIYMNGFDPDSISFAVEDESIATISDISYKEEQDYYGYDYISYSLTVSGITSGTTGINTYYDDGKLVGEPNKDHLSIIVNPK